MRALEVEGTRLLGGCAFDWASAKDIGRVLFDELRLGESDPSLRRKRPQPKGAAGAAAKGKSSVNCCLWQVNTRHLCAERRLKVAHGLLFAAFVVALASSH